VHDRFIALFDEQSVKFAGAYYCPHAPTDGCRCRKPAPGLIHDAAAELDLDVTQSIMIGDKQSDIEAGLAAGCTAGILFTSWDEVLESLR
jgi:D-glycero-D-manno-heptose 1,7-bisphosphate phosphatase